MNVDEGGRIARDNAEEAAALVVSREPYADSPTGWWSEFGGALDVTSGVVHIPQGNPVPPCPFPCSVCLDKGRQ